jgi:hypothetical protein
MMIIEDPPVMLWSVPFIGPMHRLERGVDLLPAAMLRAIGCALPERCCAAIRATPGVWQAATNGFYENPDKKSTQPEAPVRDG